MKVKTDRKLRHERAKFAVARHSPAKVILFAQPSGYVSRVLQRKIRQVFFESVVGMKVTSHVDQTLYHGIATIDGRERRVYCQSGETTWYGVEREVS